MEFSKRNDYVDYPIIFVGRVLILYLGALAPQDSTKSQTDNGERTTET